jgi:group I intron endonuclease
MEYNNNGMIYIITNKIDNNKYIGQTTTSLNERFKHHVKNAKHKIVRCRLIENAISEYGDENFSIEALITCDVSLLDFYENKFINEYNTLSPNGYNLRTGGLKNNRFCTESLTLIGKSSKYRNMSDENKKRLHDALKIIGIEHLPMYIVLSIDNRNNRNVEVIKVQVPNKKSKKFAIKNMPLHEKIELAIKYKNSLTATVIGSSSEEGLEV